MKSYLILLGIRDKWKSSHKLEVRLRLMDFRKLYNKAFNHAKIEFNDNIFKNSSSKCKAAWMVVRRETGKGV